MEGRVARFVLQYAMTPHTTTGRSPSELLFGIKLHTHLDSVIRDLWKVVDSWQARQIEHHASQAQTRSLLIGDKVIACNFSRGKLWLTNVILGKAGPLSFLALITDG